MEKKRLKYLDALKGLSILLICLNHFSPALPDLFYHWSGSFRLTAFFFVCGWIYAIRSSEVSVKTTFYKRLRQLGIPYLWFSAILLAVTGLWIAIGHWDMSAFPKELAKTVCLRGIGTLWFLPVLGIAELIFCSLHTLSGKWKSVVLLLSLGVAYAVDVIYINAVYGDADISNTNPALYSVIYPWGNALRVWPMIYTGYLCALVMQKFLQQEASSQYKCTIGITGIIILTLSFAGIVYNQYSYQLFNVAPYTVLSCLGLIAIFYALEDSRLIQFLSFWGVNSLILMCTHYTFSLELFKVLDEWMFGPNEYQGVKTGVYFFAGILLTYPMVRIINRHAPFLVGRERIGSALRQNSGLTR